VYKRQRKREATMKHSIAPGIHNVAHRRNLRKREVGSKSERSRAGEREENGRGGERDKERKKEGGNGESGRSFLLRREKRRARTRQETDARINNGYLYLLFSAPILLPRQQPFCAARTRGKV